MKRQAIERRSPSVAGLSIALLAVLTTACQRPATDNNAPATAATGQTPAAKPAKAAPTDFEALARRLVTQSAGVKEGEVVLISGQPSDAELLEDLAVNVRKAGAFPLVLYSSDRMSQRMFFDVPDKYDTQLDKADMGLIGMVDATIDIGNATAENLFEGADPKRAAARAKAAEPIAQEMMKRNVRTIEIGNNLYPTSWRADRYGMSEDELSRMFWEGVGLDHNQLQARGEQVRTALAGGDEVRITHPNGTDLKLSIKGRPVFVSDGVISDAERAAGGAAVNVYLPAGEVYITPVAGSAEGKVVQTHSYFRGKQIDDLTLSVSGGKVIAMSGTGPGYAGFKAIHDAVADPRKEEFGFLDFGINPKVRLPADSRLGTWVPAGSVTVGAGNNTWAGGDNTVGFGNPVFLPGSTVTLDGKTIVENGALKL